MKIIVAGAGVVGLSIAWELTRRGHTVTVCDAAPGSGASHAAAGMLAPAAEMVWGEDRLAPLMTQAAMRYPDFADSVATASGIDPHRLTDGTVVVGAERADAQRLFELIPAQRAQGHVAERLTGSAARALEPALGPRIAGGVSHPGDHQIDPRLYVRALLAALESAGTTVDRRNVARVREAPAAGGTATVTLDDGRQIMADEAVLATAVWHVPGTPELPVRPQRGDVIRVRIPDGRPPLLTRVVRGLVAGRPVYLVPRADNSLVIGATTREDDLADPSTEGVWQLLDDARRLVPGIVDTTIDDIVARPRPGTHDGLPIIGRLAPGLIASTGYSRHGILLSPWGAVTTADVVEGVSPNDAYLPADLDLSAGSGRPTELDAPTRGLDLSADHGPSTTPADLLGTQS